MESAGLELGRTLLVTILLLVAGIEPNPGPPSARSTRSLRFGCLNTRSAVNKAALIHDTISDFSLDMFALTEMWVVENDPNAVKLDLAPEGFSVAHVHRDSAIPRNRGGGLALIHRDSIRVRRRSDIVSVTPSTFECGMFDVRNRMNTTTICIVYRPPSTSINNFFEESGEMLEVLCAQAGNETLICGDFNCPGHDHLFINETLATLLDRFDLEQHVNGPTRNQNILDLMITAGGVSTVDIIQIHDAGMLSDHRLVTCFLPVTKMKPRKVEYTFRNIKI